MDFKKIIESSWHRTMDNIGPVLLITAVFFLVSFFSFGILAPVAAAGYTQSLLRLTRENREPLVGDLFSEIKLFLPLFVFFTLSFIAVMIGVVFLIVPGVIIGLFITFGAFYLLPLMTDKQLGLIEALKESWAMATESPVTDHIIIAVIFLGLTSLGSSIFIALLLTQPLATFVLIEAYLAKSGERVIETPPPPPPVES